MTATDPASEGAPHGRARRDRVRVFRIRVRMRRSQVQAIIAAANAMKTPFEAMLRTCAMRRVCRDKPRLDPSVDVSFQVSPEEKAAIEEAAKRSHVLPSQYVRESSMSAIADLVTRHTIPAPNHRPPTGSELRLYAPPPSGSDQIKARPDGGTTPGQHRGIG